jgi:hypothetical protein
MLIPMVEVVGQVNFGTPINKNWEKEFIEASEKFKSAAADDLGTFDAMLAFRTP